MKQEIVQKLLRKVKDDYGKISMEFSETRRYLWDDLKPLVEYVKDGDKILDLGCGNGRLFELFKGKEIYYVGMDNCETLVKVAKEKYSSVSDKRQATREFVIGDMLNLPFKENAFDAVFCVAVLPHIPSRELRLKVLKNIREVLKPDGLLIMTVWNLYQKKYAPYFFDYRTKIKKYHLFSPKDIFIPWKLKSGLPASRQDEKIWRYYHAFTRGELRRLAVRSGFKIKKFYASRYNFVLAAVK